MLGASPGSPFRSGTGHRAPWPPPSPSPAHHTTEGFGRYGVTGGLYSLFPGSTESSAAIYSQATSTSARFTHSANTYHSFIGSHKVADSLFSSGYSFCGPTPPPPPAPGPPFSPGPLVERGITQLEMMAKGFNNNMNPVGAEVRCGAPNGGAKKMESKRRSDCELFQEAAERRQSGGKRRWERDAQATPPVVKTEVTSRPSCGCRRSNVSTSSLSPLSLRMGSGPDHGGASFASLEALSVSVTSKKQLADAAPGGCSRTTPVVTQWPVVIKKEPGAGTTPCQVAEVTTSISPQHLTAVVKLEATSCAGLKKEVIPTQHTAVNTAPAIPVGIAVARQRLQDHSGKQSSLGPGPDQPACGAPELAQAPAMAVMQPPCEDRVANGIAPWAATTTHSSSLTPPTLWQYPAPVPVQLGPSDHMPLPPVGYQLVRDPITGHFLLIPATNIEHLQRAVLWPSYPALQPSLHMATQPATQHIQLFESTEPGDFLNSLSAHGHSGQTQGQTARILVQPQLTLTAAEPALPKRKATVIKVEASECTALEVKTPANSRPQEVAPVFPSTTSVAHFYYEHPTAVVQLAQTPQPTASVQTENGKRSQATSPVNPAETCLTPPPEAAAIQSESEESGSTMSNSGEGQIQVQDASNQTDTPPVSEDETAEGPMPVDVSGLQLLSNSIEQFESHRSVSDKGASAETVVDNLNSQVINGLLTLSEASVQSCTPKEPQPTRQNTDTRPADEKAAETLQMLCQQSVQHKSDKSLQRLQNVVRSLEESENCDKALTVSDTSEGSDNGTPGSVQINKVFVGQQEKASEENVEEEKSSSNSSSNIANATTTTTTTTSTTTTTTTTTTNNNNNNSNNNNMLGGLGLLCALAEQRIMEEVGSVSNSLPPNTDSMPSLEASAQSLVNLRLSTDSGSSGTSSSGVDVNRNYKTLKSERECKKFIAKVSQYFHNGNMSEPSSPQHWSGTCTSPSSADMMDAMELDMRMRLAELQRKYREKQRELSKLTPKKPGADSSSSVSASSVSNPVPEVPPSPAKRGPGRPRKKCNKLSLDSPPVSPPGGPVLPRPRVGRPPLKSKDAVLPAGRELPPPVLEKVTDLNAVPRARFDSDDCAAPKLKASKLDILKPPTLTANRIPSYSKLKPVAATVANNSTNNISARGLKLPQCNVNLVKLATNHQGNVKVKDVASTKANGDTNNKKNTGALVEDFRTKLGSVFSSDNTGSSEKHSAFLSCRLPLAHAASHTFGSKPPSCLPHPGESETHSWFKVAEKPVPAFLKPKQDSVALESSDRKLKLSSTPPSLSLLSSSQKRKVGRPKKHLSGTGQEVATETIVAKKPKSKSSLVGFLLSRSRGAKPFGHSLATFRTEHKPNKIRPKLKAEAKVKTWSWAEDEEGESMDWPTERVTPTPDTSEPSRDAWPKKTEKVEKPVLKPSTEISRPRKRKLSPSDVKSSANSGSKTGAKKITASSVATSTLVVAAPLGKLDTAKKQKRSNSNNGNTSGSSSANTSTQSAMAGMTSEGEDLPLSVYSAKLNAASCLLTQDHLNTEKQRALTVMGGLFYAGTLSAIRAPDVYGITLDGERGNRPHIYSREEILRDAILEVRPSSITVLAPGTRLCAYWSQQYRCLYPGTVAQPSSPDPELDAHFVSVEFDDGDSGRINLDDIRLLPPDYPILEYDPNPLLSLGKRRRRNSGASCESQSKDRRASAEAAGTSKGSSLPQKKELQVNGSGEKVKEDNKSNAAATTKEASPVPTDGGKKTESGEDRGNRERKRLKKRRREKLKRLMSCSDGKRRRKKHRCYEEHCRHKRHHKRHRKHRHRHGSRNKDSSSGSSGESASKSGQSSGDAVSRLSPVMEQLDILEIQQTAIRQLTTENSNNISTNQTTTAPEEAFVPAKVEAASPAVAVASANSEVEDEVDSSTPSNKKANKEKDKEKDKEKEVAKPKKCRDRQPSVESRSKMAAFLPARQLWGWSGRGFKRPGGKGRGKKEFYKSIQRGKETITVGDCAVFLSTGRPDRPYIGRIESMWEAWGTNMVVRVKWFYHPEETTGCTAQLKYPGALFESPHVDENDVQTISHKCEVLPLDGYTSRLGSEPHRYSTIYDNNDIYYLAGYYDPTTSQLSMEPGVV